MSSMDTSRKSSAEKSGSCDRRNDLRRVGLRCPEEVDRWISGLPRAKRDIHPPLCWLKGGLLGKMGRANLEWAGLG
jgi:hypothetical protein